MTETQLVSRAEEAAIMGRARVRWHEPFVMAIRMVGRDWFAFGVGVGAPLALQIPAVAEVARSPWTLVGLVPAAVALSVLAVRRHGDSFMAIARGNGETRNIRQIGEAVVIAAVVTSTMMLNSLANEGSVAGMLVKGAGVVAAAGLGYLSHLGLSAIERGRRTESCEAILDDLTRRREAESKAKTGKIKAGHRRLAVQGATEELVVGLAESGAVVPTILYAHIEKEVAGVARGLDPTDPGEIRRQLRKASERVLSGQVARLAETLDGAARANLITRTSDGTAVLDGDLIGKALSNDPRTAELLARKAKAKRWSIRR